MVTVGNDQQFGRFCKLIDRVELAEDPMFATNPARLKNRKALIDILDNVLIHLTRDWLISGMEANGIPGGPINDLGDVFASDQVAARDMKITMDHPHSQSGSVDLIGNPIKFSKTPVTYRRPPPLCGADTDEIISELLSHNDKK